MVVHAHVQLDPTIANVFFFVPSESNSILFEKIKNAYIIQIKIKKYIYVPKPPKGLIIVRILPFGKLQDPFPNGSNEAI